MQLLHHQIIICWAASPLTLNPLGLAQKYNPKVNCFHIRRYKPIIISDMPARWDDVFRCLIKFMERLHFCKSLRTFHLAEVIIKKNTSISHKNAKSLTCSFNKRTFFYCKNNIGGRGVIMLSPTN